MIGMGADSSRLLTVGNAEIRLLDLPSQVLIVTETLPQGKVGGWSGPVMFQVGRMKLTEA